MSLAVLRSQTDERLVALARQGHERAFEAIVRRYRRPLLSACRRMVPDSLAEDVVQQAFVYAWAGLRRGDDVRDLGAWLFRIVRNTAVSALRRSGHDPPALLDALTAAPSSQEEAERRAVVHETLATIARLPERQRQALLRIAVQGRSQDEVADELGVSRTAARALVHRARTALRAAASAVVPLPLLTWLASLGTDAEPISLRIARLVAGASGAGATTTLLKAGAVAGVAAAVSAPMIADHHAPMPRPAAARAAHHARAAETVAATPERAAPVRYTPPPAMIRVRRPARAGAPDRPRGARDGDVSARHRGDHETRAGGERNSGSGDDGKRDGDGGRRQASSTGGEDRRGDPAVGTGDSGGNDGERSRASDGDHGGGGRDDGESRQVPGDDAAAANSGAGGGDRSGYADRGGGDDGSGESGSSESEN